ncbi:MAG TPA: DUF4337 domain-containing protein [Bryobacteraceae bacterium]|nr:DUF4337 domain-containing protein [Bryobacteraceae bacterium]
MSEQEEVEEQVHNAREPFDKVVAGTMAIIAAMLAIVTVLGQHFNAEKLLNQQLCSDQWAYYQAKNIRRYSAQLAQDVLTQIKSDPKIVAKYTKDGDRYERDLAEISEKAHDFEKERDKTGHEAERFHIGEVFLECAIVFSSLSILVKRKPLFVFGVISALLGLSIAVTGYWA